MDSTIINLNATPISGGYSYQLGDHHVASTTKKSIIDLLDNNPAGYIVLSNLDEVAACFSDGFKLIQAAKYDGLLGKARVREYEKHAPKRAPLQPLLPYFQSLYHGGEIPHTIAKAAENLVLERVGKVRDENLNGFIDCKRGGISLCAFRGTTDEKVFDWDIKSAYPMALASIKALYSDIHLVKKEFIPTLKSFVGYSGYAKISFKFPEDTQFPSLMLGGVCPLRGVGTFTFVDVLGALKLGANIYVHEAVFFKQKDHSLFAELVKESLVAKERGDLAAKLKINSLTGKLGQDTSPIFNPYFYSYTTALIRQIVAITANELVKQGYKVFSIATDGLTTNAPYIPPTTKFAGFEPVWVCKSEGLGGAFLKTNAAYSNGGFYQRGTLSFDPSLSKAKVRRLTKRAILRGLKGLHTKAFNGKKTTNLSPLWDEKRVLLADGTTTPRKVYIPLECPKDIEKMGRTASLPRRVSILKTGDDTEESLFERLRKWSVAQNIGNDGADWFKRVLEEAHRINYHEGLDIEKGRVYSTAKRVATSIFEWRESVRANFLDAQKRKNLGSQRVRQENAEKREYEAKKLAEQGLSNAQIAAKLGVSRSWVAHLGLRKK